MRFYYNRTCFTWFPHYLKSISVFQIIQILIITLKMCCISRKCQRTLPPPRGVHYDIEVEVSRGLGCRVPEIRLRTGRVMEPKGDGSVIWGDSDNCIKELEYENSDWHARYLAVKTTVRLAIFSDFSLFLNRLLYENIRKITKKLTYCSFRCEISRGEIEWIEKSKLKNENMHFQWKIENRKLENNNNYPKFSVQKHLSRFKKLQIFKTLIANLYIFFFNFDQFSEIYTIFTSFSTKMYCLKITLLFIWNSHWKSLLKIKKKGFKTWEWLTLLPLFPIILVVGKSRFYTKRDKNALWNQ